MPAEMFDSIDPSQIPPNQDDAGYVDGNWRTFTALHGPHNLSVAVFASDDADALDDEPGDATNAQAPSWVKRELSLGHWRPCVYTPASNASALLGVLAAAGIQRSQIRLWTAHYTYVSHRCDQTCGLPAGVVADATQWTDRSGGKNLDESTVADGFFQAATPSSKGDVPVPATVKFNNQDHVFDVNENGILVHRWYDPAKPSAGWVSENLASGCDPTRGPQVTTDFAAGQLDVIADLANGGEVHFWIVPPGAWNQQVI